MLEPLVSVVMPCYNSENYVAMAMESVCSQTYQNWELLIVDDLSMDRSSDIVLDYARKDDRIKLFKLTEKGCAYGARNFATEKARGAYIAFLDSDDLWLEKKLQRQIGFMEKNSLAFSYSDYYMMDAAGNVFSRPYSNPERTTYRSLLLKSSSIHFSSVVYSVGRLGKHFFKSIDVEDYAFLLDLLKILPEAKNVPEPLTVYRIANPLARSGNKKKIAMKTWNIYRNVEKLSLLQSSYCFLHYAIKGMLKYRPYRKNEFIKDLSALLSPEKGSLDR